MDFLRQLYEQFVKLWKPLSLQQRIFIILGFSFAFIGLLALTFLRTAPEYDVLYSNLQERDAGEVVEQLKTLGVPYDLSKDGSTIKVPVEHVAETRLNLAQEGLPRGGRVGYEIFDRSRLGVTSFEQKVNLKRATEGELARTINQLNEVLWSRVQIVTPEERLFTERQQEPTASVFLNLAPNRTLKPTQIKAIQHLIAHSVEGLNPENITILDQSANNLALVEEVDVATTDLSAAQFGLRSRVERHFYKKLEAMFDRIAGVGKFAISVSVDLDFDSIERTEERYDPDSATVRSEQRQKESTTGITGDPEGVTGVSANLPSVAPLISASLSQPRRDASSSITNFEISKTIEHIIRSPSDIKNISVAVVIDGLYKKVLKPDGTTIVEYLPRDEEELEKYRRMVLAAVGNPTARDVEVVNVSLSSSVAEMEREAAEATQMNKKHRFYATIGVIAAIIGLLLFVFFLVRYLLGHGTLRIAPAPRPEAEGVEHIDLVTKETELEEVKDMLEQSPDDVVALLKAWMKEED